MIQTITSLSFGGLDIGMLFSCTLMLVNFLFGAAIAIFVLFRGVVKMCCACVPFTCKQRMEISLPSCRVFLGLLLLAFTSVGMGIGIFDSQLSGRLEHGALIVDALWSLAFSGMFFETSAFVLVLEMQKLRGYCRG